MTTLERIERIISRYEKLVEILIEKQDVDGLLMLTSTAEIVDNPPKRVTAPIQFAFKATVLSIPYLVIASRTGLLEATLRSLLPDKVECALNMFETTVRLLELMHEVSTMGLCSEEQNLRLRVLSIAVSISSPENKNICDDLTRKRLYAIRSYVEEYFTNTEDIMAFECTGIENWDEVTKNMVRLYDDLCEATSRRLDKLFGGGELELGE